MMHSASPSHRSVDGIAPVITLAARRPPRPSRLRLGVRSLGMAFALGVGVAVSVAAFGLIATTAVRHATVALPALVIFATMAAWPAMARRLDDGEDVPPFPGPMLRDAQTPGRVLQHPAARKLNRG
jgi:hypothetical protein